MCVRPPIHSRPKPLRTKPQPKSRCFCLDVDGLACIIYTVFCAGLRSLDDCAYCRRLSRWLYAGDNPEP